MKITIYGPGCAKCKKTLEAAQEAIARAGVEAEVEKVEKAADIAKAGVLFTPGLAIDGKVKSTGKVPEVARIVEWIHAAQS
jgi:small redox-active disulfide protein 2